MQSKLTSPWVAKPVDQSTTIWLLRAMVPGGKTKLAAMDDFGYLHEVKPGGPASHYFGTTNQNY